MKKNSVSRRDFLAASGVSVAAGLTGANAESPRTKPAKRPNLVFFIPDEMQAESIACYGNLVVKAPNIDRLAREGTRFSQCYVQNPVCGPSRCSLMTGWPVHVHGHRSLYYFLRPDEPNLLRYIKQNGYDVFWYGKNDMLASQSFTGSVTEWGSHPGRGRPQTGTKDPWPLDDPRELHNVYGHGSYSSVQTGLSARLLQWYVLTADVAPPDKDPRGSPPYYPTAHFNEKDWQKKILD